MPAVRSHDAAEGAEQGAPHLPSVFYPDQHHPQTPPEGKISDDLRRESLRLAETYRDKALMDNGYAAAGYARDMEQERLYAEARKRVAP